MRRAPSHEHSAFCDQCKHGNLSGIGRQLRAHFTDGQNVAFTVEQGGVFLSGLLVRPAVDAERTAYILLSYTHVQWRQRGLQRLLLSVIEATLGASRLVRQANATADADRVALCGRLGFTVNEAARAFVLSAEARLVQSYPVNHAHYFCATVRGGHTNCGSGFEVIKANLWGIEKD